MTFDDPTHEEHEENYSLAFSTGADLQYFRRRTGFGGDRYRRTRSDESGAVWQKEEIQRLQEAEVQEIPWNIQTENRLRLS